MYSKTKKKNWKDKVLCANVVVQKEKKLEQSHIQHISFQHFVAQAAKQYLHENPSTETRIKSIALIHPSERRVWKTGLHNLQLRVGSGKILLNN